MTVCEGQEAVGKNRVNLIGTQSRISEVALLIKQQPLLIFFLDQWFLGVLLDQSIGFLFHFPSYRARW